MYDDPIVNEIHKIREKMLQECGGDINRLMDRIAEEGAKYQYRIQSPEQLRRLADAREIKEEIGS